MVTRDQVIDVLKTCFDPEIPVNIWDLGLIYDVFVDARGVAAIKMTLTAPACPAVRFPCPPSAISSSLPKTRCPPGI